MEKELKEKIFASYLGSVYIKYEGSDVPRKLNIPELSICSHVIDECKLQVKSLSIISDADAEIAGCLIFDQSEENSVRGLEFSKYIRDEYLTDSDCLNSLPFGAYQYLQSQGYALPWRGLSVEDLIKYGVYELI